MSLNSKIIEKPWGKEEIIHTNKFYTLKKLIMNPLSRCSLQYHRKKIETIYVLSGSLYLTYGNSIKKLKVMKLDAGNFYTLRNKVIHRMATKYKKSIYLEASTSHLKDVVRLVDDYNRV